MMSADVLRFGDFTTKSGRRPRISSTPATTRPACRTPVWVSFTQLWSKETVGDQFDAMFGPAYKGASRLLPRFPVRWPAITASTSRSSSNRKEAKDHGEGGNIVGYKPQDGDRVIIIEDVITAGTAIRETMPVLKGCADVKVTDMFISVKPL